MVVNTCTAILFAVIGTLLGGHVLSSLWSWFIVPVFAVGAISTMQGVGFMLVTACVLGPTSVYLRINLDNDIPKDGKDIIAALAIILSTACLWLVAWLWSMFL